MFLKQIFALAAKDYGPFYSFSLIAIPGLFVAWRTKDQFTLKAALIAVLGFIPLFSRWFKHGVFIGKEVTNKYVIPSYLPSIEHFFSGLAVPALVTVIVCSLFSLITYGIRSPGYAIKWSLAIGRRIAGPFANKIRGPSTRLWIRRIKNLGAKILSYESRPRFIGKYSKYFMIGVAGCGSLFYVYYCIDWEIYKQGYFGYTDNKNHFYAPHGYVQWEQLIPELFGILLSFIVMRKIAIKLSDNVSSDESSLSD